MNEQLNKRGDIVLMSVSKEPIFINIFDNCFPRHGLIIGSPGSGKSFATSILLLSLLKDPKVRALVMDIGGSYRRLTEMLGGHYVDVRLDERYAMNPLLTREEYKLHGLQLDLIAKIIGATSRTELCVLQKALGKVFELKEEPILSDILHVLKTHMWDEDVEPHVQHVINKLLPFFEGVFSTLLNRPTRIRPFEKQITTFNLDGLKEHNALKSIMASIIALSMTGPVPERLLKKILIIEEPWVFFDDQSREMLDQLYRMSRPHNIAIWMISQLPKEFLLSKVINDKYDHNSWTMALKMRSDHELLSKFGFSNAEIERSKELQIVPRAFIEMLMKFGNNPAVVARIAPNSTDYWTATTNARECAEEAELRHSQGLTVDESIQAMAKKYPVKEW